MKPMKMLGVVLTAVLMLAGTAHALDLGGKMKGAAKDAGHAGAKKGVENEINKNLAEKDCAFKPKTTELTCDLQDILNTLKNQKTVAEKSGFSKDVDIFVEIGKGNDPKNPSLGSERSNLVRTELIKKVSWWDWYDKTTGGDQLKLSVKIR